MANRPVFVRLASLACAAFLTINCGGPTSPSGTRVIGVAGNLAFGDVFVGESFYGTLTISNFGTRPLTVSSLQGLEGFTANWTGGVIAEGSTQKLRVFFAPTSPGDYGGTVTVVGNQTSGTNTIAISGRALADLGGNWSGVREVTGAGLSERCNMNWIISSQAGDQFSGTWQTSDEGCAQAGTLSGTFSTPGRVVSNLELTPTGSPSPCTRVAGDGRFRGDFDGGFIWVDMTETGRCPGLADSTRSVSLRVKRQ